MYNPNMIRSASFCLVLVLTCFSFPMSAQKADQAKGQQNTAMLFCGDVNGVYQKSTSAQGQEFVAPDGAHKAYVKVVATVRKDTSSEENDCLNQTTLLANKGPDGPYETVFSSAGGKDAGFGNGIQLIDWSADSTALVADLITWWYYSEGWEHTILVYTPKIQSVQKRSLRELFSGTLHRECGVEAQLAGFLQDGRLAVRALPIPEEEGPSCVAAESWWAADLNDFKLSRIATNPKLQRNGHFESPERKQQ
jgi:hypothetical protein